MKGTVLLPVLDGIVSTLCPLTVTTSRGLSAFVVRGANEYQTNNLRVTTRAAIENSGFSWPSGQILVDLPAPTPHADLAVALAILIADGQIDQLRNTVVFGELGMDGRVRGVRGALPHGIAASQDGGILRVLCPAESAVECAIGGGQVPVFGVGALAEAVAWWRRELVIPLTLAPPPQRPSPNDPDMDEVRGQGPALAAIEDAVHRGVQGILLVGHPGAGKTLIARRLSGILPPMTEAERVEVSTIASVAGFPQVGLASSRPFRAPHHSCSVNAIVGGGTLLRPGEVSLAHRGVLFLDELPEFRSLALEHLAGVLCAGRSDIHHKDGVTSFPAHPQLVVGAMNPCPCGYFGHPRQPCKCGEVARENWNRRIFSGPLAPFFKTVVNIPILTAAQMLDETLRGESSATIRDRVVAARKDLT